MTVESAPRRTLGQAPVVPCLEKKKREGEIKKSPEMISLPLPLNHTFFTLIIIPQILSANKLWVCDGELDESDMDATSILTESLIITMPCEIPVDSFDHNHITNNK